MALFRGYENQQGSRSSTALVRSGHMSPAEKWILDPTFLEASMSSIFKDGVLFHCFHFPAIPCLHHTDGEFVQRLADLPSVIG